MSSPRHPDIHLADHPDRFRSLLLSWFDSVGRSLPWRRNRSLYGTWISEMMLQQTTVVVVESYWLKFMARFPDVHSLAGADEDEVLSLWSGLGYYRRARHLHAAASYVVEQLGGELPTDREGWLALPGVGPYASGAIASIGLGMMEPAIDANARRVLARWLMADPAIFPALKPAGLDAVGSELVDPDRPGDWNEALMELGALVCVAGAPRCEKCPVRDICRAGKAGTADLIPPPKAPAKSTQVELGLLAVLRGNRVLLMPPQYPPVAKVPGDLPPVRGDLSGLHGGLWGLPSGPWLPLAEPGESLLTGRIWHPFLAGLDGLQVDAIKGEPFLVGSFAHAITRYRLTVRVFGVRLEYGLPEGKMERERAEPGSRKWSVDLGPESPASDQNIEALFCQRARLGQPVSNLVTKAMSLIAKSSV